ncbi:MAG TPA: hypothetical protein VHU87_05610 [Rhizomicrobium sp.]|jgi:hypothetical protein|nr:hypothetical protein [Rhizomicrobium sp.]
MSRLRENLGLPGNKLIGERLRARLVRPHPRPIFVFGNQKSGTTAVAGLLAAATDKRATLDFAGATEPFIGRLLRRETGMADFVRLNAWAFSADIVKEPSLTFAAPELLAHFGVARAVFVIRDPYDNIRSILDRLKLPGDLPELDTARVKANRTWRSLLAGHDLGLPPDHYIATLARRWLRAVRIYESARGRLELFRYHEFRADRPAAIARLARKLELDTKRDIAAIADHPFQRAGKYRAPAEFFGAGNLARIDAICGAAAASLGFPVLH